MSDRNVLEEYMYVFVRQDLPIQEQLVHSNHATHHITMCMGINGDTNLNIPAMIVIGVPDEKAINRVLDKLRVCKISCYPWSDPDCLSKGVLSVTTVPLRDEQRIALSNYRLYTDMNNTNFVE